MVLSIRGFRAVSRQSYCMGTIVTQTLYGKKAEKAAAAVAAELKRLEKLLSFFDSDSDINRLNLSSGRENVQVHADSFTVLKTAVSYGALSGGTFDITSGVLSKLWSIGTDRFRIPSANEIRDCLDKVGYGRLYLNPMDQTVRIGPGQSLDLGGIGKGFAADRAIEILRENGIESGFVNMGGNIRAIGGKPDGKPFSIGLQDPRGARGQCFGSLRVADKAVVTSGDYERYTIHENRRYHHIMNPGTGFPADSGLMGITVVSNNAVDADALATCLFVLGTEKGLPILQCVPDAEVILVSSDRTVFVTEGLQKVFTLFPGRGYKMKVLGP